MRLANGRLTEAEHLKNDDQLLGPDGHPRTISNVRRSAHSVCETMLDLDSIGSELMYSGPVPLLEVGPTGTPTPWLSHASPADRYTVFDAADIAKALGKAKTKAKQKGKVYKPARKLGSWRFERWHSGIDFPNSQPMRIHPLLLGFVVGDEAIEVLEEDELEMWLREKLSPLVRFDRGDCDCVLARDHIQDLVNQRYPIDAEADEELAEYVCLKKAGENENESVDENESSNATPAEELLPVEDIAQAFDFNLDELWDIISGDSGHGLLLTSHYKYIPDEYLTAPRQVRRQVLAGIIEGSHSSVAPGRIRLYRREFDDDFIEDLRSLTLSLGMEMGHFMITLNELYCIEIQGDVTTLPCRLARYVEPVPATFPSLVEIKDVKYQDFGPGPAYTYSFEVDGDGLFLRGDYLVLGGHKVQTWPASNRT